VPALGRQPIGADGELKHLKVVITPVSKPTAKSSELARSMLSFKDVS